MLILPTLSYLSNDLGTNPYYAELTIGAGEVASDQTNFVVYVNLANMPAAFWTHVKSDGGDIRVRETNGADIPFDLARFDQASSTGWLFFKRTVASASATTVRIYYGNQRFTAPSVTAQNGRNAVWSDYHRVTIFSEPGVDRAGKGKGAYQYLAYDKTLVNTGASSGNLGLTATSTDHAQGAVWDGTHWYVTSNHDIRKYNSSWTLVQTALNTDTNVPGANHQGCPAYHDGYLYIPTENWNGTSSTGEHIAKYLASDLSFVTAYNVDSVGRELSGLTYNPDDGYLWASDFTDPTSFMRFTITGAYVDAVTLDYTVNIVGIQGIAYLDGLLYIVTQYRIWEISQGGVMRAICSDLLSGTTEYHGVCAKDGHIAVLTVVFSGATTVLEKDFNAVPSYGATDWLNLDANNFAHARFHQPSILTQWTISCSVSINDKSTNSRAIASYTKDASTDDTLRETLAYRQSAGVDRWGTWNSTDSWLTGGASPVVDQVYRLAVTKDGTTDRRVYIDGSGTTDVGTAGRPVVASGDAAVYLGTSDFDFVELLKGKINFVYIRQGALSANWLAAEASNWLNPTGFYSIGAEQNA